MGFTKLWHRIVTSSIWDERDPTRLLWITMLALANQDGYVESSFKSLALLARISEEDCRKGLEVLTSPDEDSRTKTDDGRRLEVTDGGWRILNYVDYREATSDDPHAVKNRERQKRHREKTSKPVDDTAWLAQIKTEYFKIGVDVDAEMVKARAWLTTPKGKGRSFTQRFFVAWLNRADRNVTLPLGSGNAGGNKTPATPAGPKAWMDMTSDEREQALIKKREDKNNQSRRENDQEVLTMPWEFPRKTVAAVRKQWQDRAAAGGSYSKNFLAKIEAEQAANPHENPDGWDTPPKRKSLETLADSPAPEKKKPFGYIDPESV